MKKRLKTKLIFLMIFIFIYSLLINGCGYLSNATGDTENIPSNNETEENSSDVESDLSHISDEAILIADTFEYTDDYDYIKQVHDWIISNTLYDTTQPINDIPASSFSSEGVLIEHLAVCQGYALSFEELIDAKGIECKVVYGRAGGISHAWNIVKLNGEWYNIDTTWDDPLINGSNVSDTSNLSYDFFLMPDEVIEQTHTISYVLDNNNQSDKQTKPDCVLTDYVYYPKSYDVTNAVILESINNISEKYYESLHTGNGAVTFFYPENEEYDTSIINDLQYYVASRDGSCTGFSINLSDTSFIGYKYITLIPT